MRPTGCPTCRQVIAWCLVAAASIAALTLPGCASLPPPLAMRPSYAVQDATGSPLAQLASAPEAPADKRSGFRLMPEGATALNARIALIRHAQLSIDAQYYVLEADGVGGLFMKELLAAADRGVRVRLLVDGLYMAGKDEALAILATQPNIEVRIFNPLPVLHGPLGWRLLWSAGDFSRINRRMHNKLLAVDNMAAIAGGRNIADDYFMQGGTANFVDMDVLLTGPLVRDLSASFDNYWNCQVVWPVQQLVVLPDASASDRRAQLDRLLGRALPAPPAERAQDVLGQHPVAPEIEAGRLTQVLAAGSVAADRPEKILRPVGDASFANSLSEQALDDIGKAREQVILVSPYFIPGDRGMRLLQASAGRGVETIVLTNSLESTDESWVYVRYARYRERLLRMGTRIYELGGRLAASNQQLGDFKSSGGRLHAKLGLLDHRRLLIGSMNLDARSARINTEIGIAIDSPELARKFELLTPVRALDAYEVTLDEGGTLTWTETRQDGSRRSTRDEPGVTWGLRLKHFFLGPFVSEDLL